MTVDPNSIDLARVMTEHLETADPDLLRELLRVFVQALMSADADAECGAAYGTGSSERTNTRNGYRSRGWDTRAGSIELAVPRLRQGSYFPAWLLERRRRAEKALVTVVATSYLLGVSTRRMEKLVEQLGIKHLSKSQVSVMARELDAHVESFRTRPLDAGPYTFVAADALTMKVREAGRVVNVHALIATGVNADGHREIQSDSARPRRRQWRGRRGLVGVSARAGRPRAVRGAAGHCPAVRGAVAASERTSATSCAGDGGSVAGARRGPRGRRGDRSQRYHGAQGRGRVGVR